MKQSFLYIILLLVLGLSCSREDDPAPVPQTFLLVSPSIDNRPPAATVYDVGISPTIRLFFNAAVERQSVNSNIFLMQNGVLQLPVNISYERNDSVVVVQPQSNLAHLTRYVVLVASELRSTQPKTLGINHNIVFITSIDSTDKFPQIMDNQLLDSVQRRTFRYFWDFGHPVSGMARERNTSNDVVTSGGTGFGIMSMVAAVSRSFITRAEGRDRVLRITNFLLNNCTRYHGAFAHWINGATGATVPFSANDNGADLVETAYLVNGLLVAREFFNGADAVETELRTKINSIWNAVEWDWFRKNNENVLYWHWSPTVNWLINQQIKGWNEALIVYVLASSSTTHGIPRIVYDNGWASNGGMRNNNSYYGIQLPLGPAFGGPLFFAHYSFLGIDPNGLSDAYANYLQQNVNHTRINYEHCRTNPRGHFGYSSQCWGLTACDIPTGYGVNDPVTDRGVIAPTAALSSFPYTPNESMAALKFFYYKLGDKLWGPYGFYDAFSLKDAWFASSTLAIDQGPIIVMIENYRSGLIWDLFTGAPEIQEGMRRLGFTAPYL